jgi:hypothetical protein
VITSDVLPSMKQLMFVALNAQAKSITSDHATTIDSTTSDRCATTTTPSDPQHKDIELKVQAKQNSDQLRHIQA